MFGIDKCFGGSRWGVIAITDDYSLALLAVEKLKEKGGMYDIKVMNIISDSVFLQKYLDVEFGD